MSARERPHAPTVKDMLVIETRGPWPSKSGGKLMVTFALPWASVKHRYFHYDSEELCRVSQDIRGLRMYTVRGMPRKAVGGNEWHRIRDEMVFVLEGSFLWRCEDLYGQTRDITLTSDVGVWMPPFLLHTYEAQEEGCGLLVVANTLYIPGDSSTHDTYLVPEFRKLQAEYI